MRIVSWNVNSVRARLPRLLVLLQRLKPDVVCLQETKVVDTDGFPIIEIGEEGYGALLHGQKSYNGVAILYRNPDAQYSLLSFTGSRTNATPMALNPVEATSVLRGFPGDPAPNEARVISANLGELRLVNVYVVNGKEKGTEQFDLKRRWTKALAEWIRGLPSTPPLLVVGDFNIAPEDRDVWNPTRLRESIHCTEEERGWLRYIQGERLHDLLRVTTQEPNVFTWWPYQPGAFERNEGLRFDLALGDAKVTHLLKKIWIDRDERGMINQVVQPSDHAPIVVDLAEP